MNYYSVEVLALETEAVVFRRVDPSDGASEILTLVSVDGADGYYCEGLDSTQNVLVQITTGTDPGDDLVGIYDLNGERVSLGNATWTVLGAAEVAAEIIAEVKANYSRRSPVLPEAPTGWTVVSA